MMTEEYFTMDKKRYETKGINERLALNYRMILWQLADELKKSIELDYLQVFEFFCLTKDGKRIQKIVHRQEQPAYECAYEFTGMKAETEGKVFLIDDGENCTMMWADEY